MAQRLTKQEASEIANRLYEEKILSDVGRNELLKQISTKSLYRFKSPDPIDGSYEETNELSQAQILYFLTKAFGSEMDFRSGIIEQRKFLAKSAKKFKFPLSEKDFLQYEQESEKRLKKSKGYQMEAAITDEDIFPEEAWEIVLHPFSFPQADTYGLIHPERSAVGKHCRRTINDLLTLGLIDSAIHRAVTDQITKNKLVLEVLAVEYAAELSAFYEDYEENKAKERNFLAGLKNAGVFSEDGLARLLSTYGEKEIKRKFDYVAFADRAKVFQVNRLPTDPEARYKFLFQELQAIVPSFDFSNFSLTLKKAKDWDDNTTEVVATIAFAADGQTYTNTFFHNFLHKDPEQLAVRPDSVADISIDFHKGINKLLADRNSPYRLYFANKPGEDGMYGNTEFGLILLTEEQLQAWGTGENYFLFGPVHDNSFTSTNIQLLLEQYEEIGLFSHLTEEELHQAKACVTETEIESYQSILLCFPKTIVLFDWETSNFENPYQELTNLFMEASRGAFKPANITDTFGKNLKSKKTTFAFTLNDKNYARQLKMESDWLDPDFLELIHHTLQEQQVNGKFYHCVDNGQESGYIFLTDAQYQHLQEKQPELFPEY